MTAAGTAAATAARTAAPLGSAAVRSSRAKDASTAAAAVRSSPQQSSIFDLLDQGDAATLEPPNSQPRRVDQTKTGKPVRHGTAAGYANHGCRCDECREWKREDSRRYREANRDAVLERKRRYREANRDAVRECDRRWYEANRDAVRERKRRRYEANRDAVRERHRRYYEANRDAVRERHRRWREANREAALECDRRWREANRDRVRTHYANRRARKRAAHIETVDYQEIYQRDNWTCQLCGVDLKDRPGEIHVDHIVPLARGGLHYRANLWTTCQTCNLSKGAKLVEPWHIWLAVPPDLDGSLNLDLDLDAAPADPWTDFKDVPAAAIRPLLTTRKEA